MMDGGSRRAGPWPLLAMTVLVLLLAVFLFIKWQRRDAGPAVVKDPVPALTTPVPVTPQVPTAQTPQTPVTPPKDPREETYKEQVREAGLAIEAKHWDDAESAVKKARDLFDRPELNALLDKVTLGRDAEEAAVKAEADARRKQEKAWVDARDRVDKDREKFFYDDAWAALENLAKDFPKILQDQRYIGLTSTVRAIREDADSHYKRYMAEAEKAFSEGRFAPAILSARKAGEIYPERKAIVKEFQDRVNDILLQRTMVRVACNVPCTIGSEEPKDENPVRVVTLPTFFIDKYEVTNEEYLGFVTATGHAPPPPSRNVPPAWNLGKPVVGKEKHPVVNVTYADAEAYSKWAGKRLPTADEWEVAARGPDKREYPWGNAFTEKENVFHCNCVEYWQLTKTLYGTMPVDAFDGANSASFYGVYGMGGNAWEWTSTSVKRKVAEKEEEFRVLKGGSFMTPAKAIRCANAYPEDPTLGHPDVGFRCVRDVK